MGTRGLTVITQDGQIKLSNYRQWDSYFEVGGLEFLQFCREKLQEKRQIEVFNDKVRLLKDVSKDQKFLDKVNNTIQEFDSFEDYKVDLRHLFPQFSRDTGIDILYIINELYEFEFRNKKYPVLIDTDLCGIEYINVLDLDNNRALLLREKTDNFKSLPTNSIIKKTFISKGYECFLSYKLGEIPSDIEVTVDYEATIKTTQEDDEIPF